MALLRVKWTEARKCQSNPSSTGEWHASTTKNKKHGLYWLEGQWTHLTDTVELQEGSARSKQKRFRSLILLNLWKIKA